MILRHLIEKPNSGSKYNINPLLLPATRAAKFYVSSEIFIFKNGASYRRLEFPPGVPKPVRYRAYISYILRNLNAGILDTACEYLQGAVHEGLERWIVQNSAPAKITWPLAMLAARSPPGSELEARLISLLRSAGQFSVILKLADPVLREKMKQLNRKKNKNEKYGSESSF